MTRTRLLLAAAMVTIAGQATQAQRCGGRTIDEVIASCDSAFPSNNILTYSARGWCYLINGASCAS